MIMAEYIYTVSGIKFYPMSPEKDCVDIEDIAHALSMIARANGHFREFHSVASHCIECCTEALARGYSPKTAIACLLHDSAEAYLSDVTTPVKNKLPDYRNYEDKLLDVIYEKYVGNLTDKEKELVALVDKDMLYLEFLHYTGIEISEKRENVTSPDYEFKPFGEVKDEFLKLFYELSDKIK